MQSSQFFPQDNKKMYFQLQQQLALTGDNQAQYKLGICYAKGEGVDKNQDEALRYFKLAADNGNKDAKNKLRLWDTMQGKFDSNFCLTVCANDINQPHKLHPHDSHQYTLLEIAMLKKHYDVIIAAIENGAPYNKKLLVSRAIEQHQYGLANFLSRELPLNEEYAIPRKDCNYLNDAEHLICDDGFSANIYSGQYKNQSVAFKIFREKSMKKVFLNEITINEIISSTQFKSPHLYGHYIVSYYGYSVDPTDTIILEQAKSSLTDYISSCRQDLINDHSWHFPYRQFATEMSKAVYYLHEVVKIIHNDIKPDNYLVFEKNGECHVKLADFGVSHFGYHCLNYSGTPEFMAPEVKNKTATNSIKSDIYSLASSICKLKWSTHADNTEFGVNMAIAEIIIDQLDDYFFPCHIAHLLLQGLDEDPVLRPNARDFVKMLEQDSTVAPINVLTNSIQNKTGQTAQTYQHAQAFFYHQQNPSAGTIMQDNDVDSSLDNRWKRDVEFF